MKIIKSFRWKILSKNPMTALRTPYSITQEWKGRKKRSFSRFLIRFLYEEISLWYEAYKVWLNRQLFLSHNITIGENLTIGPDKNIFFIPEGGRIDIGNNVKINTPLELVATTSNFKDVSIFIGDGTHIGSNVCIRAAKSIKIGNNCLIAPSVIITDTNAHPLDPEKRKNREKIPDQEIRPVEIGDNVWIGERAFIGPGVHLGGGSIVGANSAVTKDVAPNTIVVGNPARLASWLKKTEKDITTPLPDKEN